MKIDMEQFDPTDANAAMDAAEAYNRLHDIVRMFLLKGYRYPSWLAFPRDETDKLAKLLNLEVVETERNTD